MKLGTRIQPESTFSAVITSPRFQLLDVSIYYAIYLVILYIKQNSISSNNISDIPLQGNTSTILYVCPIHSFKFVCLHVL